MQADIDVCEHHSCVERNHRPGRQRDSEGHDRREDEDPLVGRARDDGFLQEHLQPVGKALQQAEGADYVRPAAQIDRRPDLAVDIDYHGDCQHERKRDQKDTGDRRGEPRELVIQAEGLEKFGHSAASAKSSPCSNSAEQRCITSLARAIGFVR